MALLGSDSISMLAFFGGGFGWLEALVIVGAILLLFGGKKLPELARGLGKGIGEFKKGLKGLEDEVESSGEGDEAKTGRGPAPEEPKQGTGNKE